MFLRSVLEKQTKAVIHFGFKIHEYRCPKNGLIITNFQDNTKLADNMKLDL